MNKATRLSKGFSNNLENAFIQKPFAARSITVSEGEVPPRGTILDKLHAHRNTLFGPGSLEKSSIYKTRAKNEFLKLSRALR